MEKFLGFIIEAFWVIALQGISNPPKICPLFEGIFI